MKVGERADGRTKWTWGMGGFRVSVFLLQGLSCMPSSSREVAMFPREESLSTGRLTAQGAGLRLRADWLITAAAVSESNTPACLHACVCLSTAFHWIHTPLFLTLPLPPPTTPSPLPRVAAAAAAAYAQSNDLPL